MAPVTVATVGSYGNKLRLRSLQEQAVQFSFFLASVFSLAFVPARHVLPNTILDNGASMLDSI